MSGARFIYPLRFCVAEGREGVGEGTIRVGEGRGSVLSSSGEMSKLRARLPHPRNLCRTGQTRKIAAARRLLFAGSLRLPEGLAVLEA